MDKIKTLIVDDEKIVRNLVRGLLLDDPGCVIVGEAGDGDLNARMRRPESAHLSAF